MTYKADLHIHSCLSPCGSLDMSPCAIVERAAEIGLNCLALTDHNSTLNCGAAAKLCERNGILFFPGLEVTTAEEAHIVCLFDNVGAAEELGRMVYDKMPPVMNRPEKHGDQVIVNEDDEIEGEIEKYLITACEYTIDKLRETVTDMGGLFIAAHVDKPCFSVTSQLGELKGEFSAAELSRAGAMREESKKIADGYAVTSASDSHYLHTIGSAYIEFESTADSGFDSLRRALESKRTKPVVFDRAFRTAPKQRAQT